MVIKPSMSLPVTVLEDSAHFAEILRATRTAARMSNAGMAERLHVVSSLISLRETGQRQLTVQAAIDTLEVVGYELAIVRKGWFPRSNRG